MQKAWIHAKWTGYVMKGMNEGYPGKQAHSHPIRTAHITPFVQHALVNSQGEAGWGIGAQKRNGSAHLLDQPRSQTLGVRAGGDLGKAEQ